jgi:ketosteroid isomerase-like protein
MPEESMTPDLVEVARRLLDATNRKDFDALQGFWGPDPTLDMSPLGLGVYKGAAAVRAFMEDWLGAYDEFELEVEELDDLGNGVLFQVAVQRGMPRGSMARLEVRYGSVSTVVDGVVERATFYYDIDEARAAAERRSQERG